MSVRNNIENREREAELEMMNEKIRNQLFYARDMFFNHNVTLYSGFISTQTRTQRDPFFLSNIRDRFLKGEEAPDWMGGPIEISEVVFVHSEAEAEGFAEDVFVAWPTEWSETLLARLNEWLDPEIISFFQPEGMVIDISDLNIELPLTLEQMVNDWEIMIEILERLDPGGGNSNRRTIRRGAEIEVSAALRLEREEATGEEVTEDEESED